MPTIAELLQELDQEAGNTRRALERVPADRFDWKPHPRSRAMGELAMHLATLPGAIADVAMQPSFSAGAPPPDVRPASSAELLASLDRSVSHARETIGGMDDAGLGTPWRMTVGGKDVLTITRGALLRTVLFNHWYHHRGAAHDLPADERHPGAGDLRRERRRAAGVHGVRRAGEASVARQVSAFGEAELRRGVRRNAPDGCRMTRAERCGLISPASSTCRAAPGRRGAGRSPARPR